MWLWCKVPNSNLYAEFKHLLFYLILTMSLSPFIVSMYYRCLPTLSFTFSKTRHGHLCPTERLTPCYGGWHSKEELHVSDPSGDTKPWPCVFCEVPVCVCVRSHGVGNGNIVRGRKRAEKVRKEGSAYSTYRLLRIILIS